VADDVEKPPANGRKAEAPLPAVETRHCEACADEVRTHTPGSDRSNDQQPPPVAGDLREAERQAILAQVRDCDGNLTQAARRLEIARSTLYLRLAKYGRRPARSSGRSLLATTKLYKPTVA
jgi:DNA-binding NtrC family response regulator